MKKIIALLLSVVLCFALVACGGEKKEELTTDDIVGTWILEKAPGQRPPFTHVRFDLYKGGTGEAHDAEVKANSYHPVRWEIVDGVVVISYSFDPISWSHEMSDDKTQLTEISSGCVFVKQ